MEDLLTTDGKQLACEALNDFRCPIGSALVTFRKGERIREWHVISELRKDPNNPNIASTEPELQRRVLQAREHRRQSRLWLVALISALASVASAIAAWAAACRN